MFSKTKFEFFFFLARRKTRKNKRRRPWQQSTKKYYNNIFFPQCCFIRCCDALHDMNWTKSTWKKRLKAVKRSCMQHMFLQFFVFSAFFSFTVTPQSTMKPHNFPRHWSSFSPNCQWTLKIAPKAPLFAAKGTDATDWVVFDVACVAEPFLNPWELACLGWTIFSTSSFLSVKIPPRFSQHLFAALPKMTSQTPLNVWDSCSSMHLMQEMGTWWVHVDWCGCSWGTISLLSDQSWSCCMQSSCCLCASFHAMNKPKVGQWTLIG